MTMHSPGNPWNGPDNAPVVWRPQGQYPQQAPGQAVARYQPAYPQPGFGQPGYGAYQQPVYVMPLKSSGIAYLLWFFLGFVGAHHFYADRPGSGVTMLVLWLLGMATVWFFVGLIFLIPVGIWLFIDLFLIPGYIRDANARATGFRPY